MSNSKKKNNRYLHMSTIIERYPEIYDLSYDDDEVALKLKYLSLFYNVPFRKWRFDRPAKSYFFKQYFLERVVKEFINR